MRNGFVGLWSPTLEDSVYLFLSLGWENLMKLSIPRPDLLFYCSCLSYPLLLSVSDHTSESFLVSCYVPLLFSIVFIVLCSLLTEFVFFLLLAYPLLLILELISGACICHLYWHAQGTKIFICLIVIRTSRSSKNRLLCQAISQAHCSIHR